MKLFNRLNKELRDIKKPFKKQEIKSVHRFAKNMIIVQSFNGKIIILDINGEIFEKISSMNLHGEIKVSPDYTRFAVR